MLEKLQKKVHSSSDKGRHTELELKWEWMGNANVWLYFEDTKPYLHTYTEISDWNIKELPLRVIFAFTSASMNFVSVQSMNICYVCCRFPHTTFVSAPLHHPKKHPVAPRRVFMWLVNVSGGALLRRQQASYSPNRAVLSSILLQTFVIKFSKW